MPNSLCVTDGIFFLFFPNYAGCNSYTFCLINSVMQVYLLLLVGFEISCIQYVSTGDLLIISVEVTC